MTETVETALRLLEANSAFLCNASCSLKKRQESDKFVAEVACLDPQLSLNEITREEYSEKNKKWLKKRRDERKPKVYLSLSFRSRSLRKEMEFLARSKQLFSRDISSSTGGQSVSSSSVMSSSTFKP